MQQNQQKVGEEKEDKVEETLKNGAAGSATLMIIEFFKCTKCRLCRRMVIGPRTVRRTSEIKKQTEARTVESSGDGKRGGSLRPLIREVKFFLTTHTHTHTYHTHTHTHTHIYILMYILLSAMKKKLAFLCVILN